MPKRKIKTKKTQLEAIQRYNARHDRITLTLPAGTKNKIAQITDKSINKYIADLICCSLNNCTEKELNCIDADKAIYTDTDIELDKTDKTEQNTIDINTTNTSTIGLTEQSNVMDLFD